MGDCIKSLLKNRKLLDQTVAVSSSDHNQRNLQARLYECYDKINNDRERFEAEIKLKDEKILELEETILKHTKTIASLSQDRYSERAPQDEAEQIQKQQEEINRLKETNLVYKVKIDQLQEQITNQHMQMVKSDQEETKQQEESVEKEEIQPDIPIEVVTLENFLPVQEGAVVMKDNSNKNLEEEVESFMIDVNTKTNAISKVMKVFRVMQDRLRLKIDDDNCVWRYFMMGECQGYSDLKKKGYNLFIIQEQTIIKGNASSDHSVGLYFNMFDLDWRKSSEFQFVKNFKLITLSRMTTFPILMDRVEIKFNNKSNEIIARLKGHIRTENKFELSKPFCLLQID
ncbi:hypothetical protein FGO68_gene11707 [Halteria grandinella]|uniref:Uncharacterized protein n=1 Tax=Halteria grandinella TaxID=5974 RepID=A0A8J8T147_HALGN|nr:hypothetical protein FGO68_gene11707 [Halteria grandinella]